MKNEGPSGAPDGPQRWQFDVEVPDVAAWRCDVQLTDEHRVSVD